MRVSTLNVAIDDRQDSALHQSPISADTGVFVLNEIEARFGNSSFICQRPARMQASLKAGLRIAVNARWLFLRALRAARWREDLASTVSTM